MVQGHTEIPGGESHRHEKGFGNETMKNQTEPYFCNKQLFGMDAGGCTDKPWQLLCAVHSGFPTKMGEEMIMTS